MTKKLKLIYRLDWLEYLDEEPVDILGPYGVLSIFFCYLG